MIPFVPIGLILVAAGLSLSNVITLIAAFLAAAGAVAAAVISQRYGSHLAQKVQEVHVLVNERLDRALGEIAALKRQRADSEQKIETLKGEPSPGEPAPRKPDASSP